MNGWLMGFVGGAIILIERISVNRIDVPSTDKWRFPQNP
jgi:hypothetical protein